MITKSYCPLTFGLLSIEQEVTEVHPLSESSEVTPETNEAGEGDSKMELATSLNDSGHDNPIEKKMEETDLQGTIKQQLEKQASFKKGMLPSSCSMFPLY